MKHSTILVTGNAGFIGSHVTNRLLDEGYSVVGIDNVNDYYDQELKEARLEITRKKAQVANEKFGSNYTFYKNNLADAAFVNQCFNKHKFNKVIHLAAQAGVRYSLVNPAAYVESNIITFTNILEACRHHQIEHLTYASTSSVYGANTNMPFSEHHGVDHPLQFYAATKRANELMAHSYSHLFGLPTTGLRFFTVYGPWGRPDMALFLFTKNIIEGKPIQVFNHGNHTRDFTYIGDIVEGIVKASENIAKPNKDWNSDNPDPSSSNAPFNIYNIGNNNPVKLNEYISAIEDALDKKAIKELLPLQPGDVPETYADITKLANAVGYIPQTTVKDGVANFVRWFREYYKV